MKEIVLNNKTKTVEINRLILEDLEVFNILSVKEEEERIDFIKKAIKIGLIAIKDITITDKVDYVQKEFERLEKRLNDIFDQKLGKDGLAGELEIIFGENGELRSTLEDIFGDEGTLMKEILNADNGNSPLGKLKECIESCLVGKDSEIYCMLDPHQEDSPANRLRNELVQMLKEIKDDMDEHIIKKGITGLTPLKGGDFEDRLEAFLLDKSGLFGDHVERIGTSKGKTGGKRGDFIIEINGSHAKIVVEAKSQGQISLTKSGILGYLDDSMKNRDAQFAIAVSENSLPQGAGKYREYEQNKIVCEFGDDGLPLEIAYKVSRAKLLMKSNETIGKVDVNEINGKIEEIENDLKTIQGIKTKLTQIEKLSNGVKDELDGLKERIQFNIDTIDDLLANQNDSLTNS